MPKRRAAEALQQRHEGSKQPFQVDRGILASLAWDGVPTLAGDEDDIYRWITEPDLWASVLMGDVEARVYL